MTYTTIKDGQIHGANTIFLHFLNGYMKSILVQNIKNGSIMGLHKSYEWVDENVLQYECVS